MDDTKYRDYPLVLSISNGAGATVEITVDADGNLSLPDGITAADAMLIGAMLYNGGPDGDIGQMPAGAAAWAKWTALAQQVTA